jgi:hypothetical protein
MNSFNYTFIIHIMYHTFIIQNNTLYTTVFIWFVFLYDIMMAAEATATCRWIDNDNAYIIDVHFLVCYLV